MKDLADKIVAFLEKVKDDPELSDAFRAAAHELHEELAPKPAKK